MLKTSFEVLNGIGSSLRPFFEFVLHFSEPETYTEDDLLVSVGDIGSSMSSGGGYEIGNTTVTLKNKGYFFSRKFVKEMPNRRRAEVFVRVGSERVLVFAGIVADSWKLTPLLLTLNLNA